MKIVSNTEANTWQMCQRKYLYQFVYNVAPKTLADALDIGLFGHELLAAFYEAKKNGASKEEAIKAVDALVLPYLQGNGNMETASMLYSRMIAYAEEYWDEPWQIIDVEGYYEIPLSEEISLGLKVDLIVVDTKQNKILIPDHKFTYDFKQPIEHSHNAQEPKYIGALRRIGIQVSHGLLNQFRYRKDAKELFKRTPIIPNQHEIDRMLEEQLILAEAIVQFRDKTLEEQRRLATRNMVRWNCQYCPYKDPCKVDLQGESIDLMLKVNFEENKYGYRRHETSEEI